MRKTTETPCCETCNAPMKRGRFAGEWNCPNEHECEECGELAHTHVVSDDGFAITMCDDCAAAFKSTECDDAAESAAESMDGDHETALASVYGGEW